MGLQKVPGGAHLGETALSRRHRGGHGMFDRYHSLWDTVSRSAQIGLCPSPPGWARTTAPQAASGARRSSLPPSAPGAWGCTRSRREGAGWTQQWRAAASPQRVAGPRRSSLLAGRASLARRARNLQARAAHDAADHCQLRGRVHDAGGCGRVGGADGSVVRARPRRRRRRTTAVRPDRSGTKQRGSAWIQPRHDPSLPHPSSP
jgi:hypothetical protein